MFSSYDGYIQQRHPKNLIYATSRKVLGCRAAASSHADVLRKVILSTLRASTRADGLGWLLVHIDSRHTVGPLLNRNMVFSCHSVLQAPQPPPLYPLPPLLPHCRLCLVGVVLVALASTAAAGCSELKNEQSSCRNITVLKTTPRFGLTTGRTLVCDMGKRPGTLMVYKPTNELPLRFSASDFRQQCLGNAGFACDHESNTSM